MCLFAFVSSSRADDAALRMIVDADTANEIDDLFAIVRALGEPRFRIEGLTSSQWHKGRGAGADSVSQSQRLNEDILRLMGLTSIPHPEGAREPLADSKSPRDSAAARWIIAKAKDTPAGQKLVVVSLGSMTNLASALLIDPSIVPKVRFHVMGLSYDDRASKWSRKEFNADNDQVAVDVLLETEGLELHVMTGSVSGQMQLLRETVDEQLRGKGPVEDYLVRRWESYAPTKKRWIMWDIAAIQALANPSSAFEVQVPTPSTERPRTIHVYTEIDQARMETEYWASLRSQRAERAKRRSWAQFRGPNASGISSSSEPLPDRVGPDQNVLWRVDAPAGHSSPAVTEDRIYLTAVKGKSLWTIALERQTGKLVWEREAPLRDVEALHSIGSLAQPSPVTDGDRVISFFGSSGLLCYDRDGERLWYMPMGPFNNDFGAGASPIISGDRVILSQDHDADSFVMAIDKRTGKVIWKTDRSEFPRGYATPILWSNAGREEVVVAGTLRVVGYDLANGKETWTVRGISRLVNVTPTVDEGGTLYVSSWTSGGDSDDRFKIDPWGEFLADNDRDGDKLIVRDEVPDGPLKSRFNQVDRDKSGEVTREEYEIMRGIMKSARNVCMAIRPGANGDVTDTHVLWRHRKRLPYVPSPLVRDGVVFIVKKGGIVSSLDAKTGKPLKEGRVSAQGNYYASPVSGDGKIYMINQRGDLSVIRAAGEWEEIHSAKLREPTYATPAIYAGRIYVRTAKSLYCFGLPE
jgi:outer membrane protein assembly factor BamB/inosine-uridine nucleoside N-ribohydrolase